MNKKRIVLIEKISLEEVEKIIQKIKSVDSIRKKIEVIKTFFKDQNQVASLNRKLKFVNLPEFGKLIVWAFCLLGQDDIVNFLLDPNKDIFLKKMLLINQLERLDNFYYKQGGFFNYQLEFSKCVNKKRKYNLRNFSSCSFYDVNSLSQSEISLNIFLGIKALLETGFFILSGGKAERFFNSKSEGSMASLEFFKKSLLERIIEDVEGLETLYERFFNKKITIPIVIMVSSSEPINSSFFSKIKKTDRYLNGFFKILIQSDFPVISSEGLFLLDKNGELVMFPGGHGMLWKEAYEQGFFHYFKSLGINHILIRQINNPLAGLNENLLLLLGTSCVNNKFFGVISCAKDRHFSEGVWVKLHNKNTYSYVNIEYVQFPFFDDRLIEEAPANTNILYFNLKKNWNRLSKLPRFNHILNMKTLTIKNNEKNYFVLAGRLECLVQDFTKLFNDDECSSSSVIILHSLREKVISSIKRPLGKNYLETPEKAFFDYLNCSRELLRLCHILLPKRRSWDDFLNLGPEFIFDYHPSLGPLYSLIQKKIYQGSFFENSIVELNIMKVFFRNLNVAGHFVVNSTLSGKCIMRNVEIKNRGSFFENPRESWKGKLCTQECLKIVLNENAKIYAENLVLEGNISIEVPKGESWELFMNNRQELDYKIISKPLKFICNC